MSTTKKEIETLIDERFRRQVTQSFNTEFEQYYVKHLKSKPIAGITFEGSIMCRKHEENVGWHQLLIYCLTPDSPDRDDIVYQNDNGSYEGRTYVRNELFLKMLDMLRNEKPLIMTFNVLHKRTSLQTRRYEPVGEEES